MKRCTVMTGKSVQVILSVCSLPAADRGKLCAELLANPPAPMRLSSDFTLQLVLQWKMRVQASLCWPSVKLQTALIVLSLVQTACLFRLHHICVQLGACEPYHLAMSSLIKCPLALEVDHNSPTWEMCLLQEDPMLVFCASRKQTQMCAELLADLLPTQPGWAAPVTRPLIKCPVALEVDQHFLRLERCSCCRRPCACLLCQPQADPEVCRAPGRPAAHSVWLRSF